MPGETFNITDDHVLGVCAESFFKGFYFRRSAAAPCGRVGFVRHKEGLFGELTLVQTVNVFDLFHKFGHNFRHMLGVQPAYVVGAVGRFGQQQPCERFHAPVPDQSFILYNHGHGAGSDYQAVSSLVEWQRCFGHVLFGRGCAGGEESGHGPFLNDIVGYVVGGYDYDPFSFAGPQPAFGGMHGLGCGGAGSADVHRGAFCSHPLGKLAVRYWYHFHKEVLAESEHILLGTGVVFTEVGFHPDPKGLFILRRMYLVYQRVVYFPHLGRAFPLVFVIEITGDFGDQRFHGREGGGEYHACFASQRFRQGPFLRQVAAGGGLLVVMDQRQPRVLKGQYARGHGHLKRGIKRLGYVVRHAEFFLYVELSRAGRKLYGLIHGIYLRYAVVARG